MVRPDPYNHPSARCSRPSQRGHAEDTLSSGGTNCGGPCKYTTMILCDNRAAEDSLIGLRSPLNAKNMISSSGGANCGTHCKYTTMILLNMAVEVS